MRRPRSVVHLVVSTALAAAVTVSLPGGGFAVPPKPPNPSDGDIEAGHAGSRDMATRVGTLTNRLAEAESRLDGLSAEVELAMEDSNKARVDFGRAERAASSARSAAQAAASDVRVSGERIEQERRRVDQFSASSYRQGSALGSLTAYVGTGNPNELLDRATLLDTISSSQHEMLDQLQRARVDMANKDSRARAVSRDAEAKWDAANAARTQAEAAKDAAVAAQESQTRRSRELESERDQVTAQLIEARGKVEGLESQRDRFQSWLQDKQQANQQAEQSQAAAATAGAGSQAGSAQAQPSSGHSGSSAEAVVQRALRQVGVTYAWGGGDADGPTQGVRDGGVADEHGDYLKTGFDCSGLMLYSFAGVGIELDHYSGYQAQAGQRVSLSRMERGDMLFWQSSGKIHHVALYLGDGRMVEAPYSGSKVRVVPVRYGGIAPYAVRMF